VRIATALTKQHPAFRFGLILWGDRGSDMGSEKKGAIVKFIGGRRVEIKASEKPSSKKETIVITGDGEYRTEITADGADEAKAVIAEAVQIVGNFMRQEADGLLDIVADSMDEALTDTCMLDLIARPHSQFIQNFAAYILATESSIKDPEVYEKFKNIVLGGADGGKNAAMNRHGIRLLVSGKVKEIIQKQYLWNDGTQTIKSIADTIWTEIKTAMDSNTDWQSIPSKDLLKAKIGRQSVYEAVKETDHR